MLYFKGIFLNSTGNDHTILANKSIEVVLKDPNYQELSKTTLTTNDFGSLQGEFILPQGKLNGRFILETEFGSHRIQVEEYKRPKFDVEINPIQDDYRLGEKVTITGKAKAFAGFAIDGAEVTYNVTRITTFPWWCWWQPVKNESKQLAYGNVKTNKKGEFSLTFPAIPKNSISEKSKPTFTFEVEIDVTDISGETHSASTFLSIGFEGLKMKLDIPEKLAKGETTQFPIIVTNQSGEPVDAKGKIEIYKLSEPEAPITERLWNVPDTTNYTFDEYKKSFPHLAWKNEALQMNWPHETKVYSGSFDTQKKKEIVLTDLSNWKNGVYKVILSSTDKFGEKVTNYNLFTLYNKLGKKVPYKTDEWFVPLKTTCQPGETAKLLIGSTFKQKVLVEIEHQGKIAKSYWLNIDNEQKAITFPIEEKHRGNISIHVTYVHHNRGHQINQLITVPFSNKNLNIDFETFRNKLLPGEKEEWKLKITNENNMNAVAELMTTLYDASLDEFLPHNFALNLYHSYSSRLAWNVNTTQIESFNKTNFFNSYIRFKRLEYPTLNWFGFSNNFYDGSLYRNHPYALEDASLEKVEMAATSEAIAEESESKLDKVKSKNSENTPEKKNNIKPRTNFNETAFFYPQLRTDKDGSILVKFTIPESLTKWKMLGLAHTKDLKIGTTTNELVTQKELMITANVPRFFRQGDQIIFSAKVTNLSDNQIDADATIKLVETIRQKPIPGDFTTKNFSLKKDESKVIEWRINVPKDAQAITYTISTKGSNHEDGEEMTIPVLSNKMLVTETLPMKINGKNQKTYTFEKLKSANKSNTLTHQQLTLEFTSNPAWYAIQALPYLIEYPYECAEQTFSRYYANTIASDIVNSSPKIKKVFDSWKNQTPDALLSNLEKNQELKSLILEETPWVLNAQNESERKRRVSLLFDLNKMNRELDQALRRLKSLQLPNGAWPWFEGMNENAYITRHILAGFGKLQRLNMIENRSNKNMLEKAIVYSDNALMNEYIELKDHCEKNKLKLEDQHINPSHIQHLYMRSFYETPINDKQKEAYDFYFSQSTKQWNKQTFYLQAMLAIVFHRSGERNTASLIMKALRENAIESEEEGIYWKFPRGWFWYQAPIESQAIMAEAFYEVENDKEIVDGIHVWLINHKRTNDWKTTKATTEACYALLMRNNNLVSNTEQVKITVGNKKIDPLRDDKIKVEAGSGYFKTSWNAGEINSSMANIELKKNTDGLAYGAVYWQYFEELDKISSSETPLILKKKLFIEDLSDKGKTLTPVLENTKLSVGDKIIVRLELSTNQPMEYLHLKDMRASGFEPENVISSYKYQGGLGYYESTKDASTNFFISYMPKGSYVFEYPLRVTHKGSFSNGISSIQCMYAPEFTSHSESVRVEVE